MSEGSQKETTNTMSCKTQYCSTPVLPPTVSASQCSPTELMIDLVVAYSKLANAVRSTASSDLNATLSLQSCGGLSPLGCSPSQCNSGNPAIAAIVNRALLDISVLPLANVEQRIQVACCAIYQLVRCLTVSQFSTVVYGLIACSGPLAAYLVPSPDALAAALCSLLPYFWSLSPTLVQCINGSNSSCSGQKGGAALFKIDARAAFPCELLPKTCDEPCITSCIPGGPVLVGFTILLNMFDTALDCKMTGLSVTVNQAEIVAETHGNFPLVQLPQCALQYPYASQ